MQLVALFPNELSMLLSFFYLQHKTNSHNAIIWQCLYQFIDMLIGHKKPSISTLSLYLYIYTSRYMINQLFLIKDKVFIHITFLISFCISRVQISVKCQDRQRLTVVSYLIRSDALHNKNLVVRGMFSNLVCPMFSDPYVPPSQLFPLYI